MKAHKAAYKRKLAEAIEWFQGEGRGEKLITAARIYNVNVDSIRMAIKRTQSRQKKKA